jgi:putative membrane protein
MHNRSLALATASALSLSLACAAFAQTPAPSLVANAADSTFMTHAAADGIAEVQMGQLALDKSSDNEVKQLAKRIVDDHTKANEALRVLAQAKQVTLPSVPSTDATKMADSMKKMEGTKFDQAWADAMVKGHQQAVALFTAESGKTQDADLKKFSSSTLPTLKGHLDTSREVQDHLAVSNVRDKAMGSSKAMDDSSFAHSNPTTPSPITPGTAATQPPARAGSMGSH